MSLAVAVPPVEGQEHPFRHYLPQWLSSYTAQQALGVIRKTSRASLTWLQYFMRKYRLLIEILVLILVLIGLRALIHYFGGEVDGLSLSQMSFFSSGGLFLVGFVLNGVLADFKEAEKIPSALANKLNRMEDVFVEGARMSPADSGMPPASVVRARLLVLVDHLFVWFGTPSALRNDDAVIAAIAGVIAGVKMPVALLDKYLQTVEELRVLVMRVSVMSATSYLVPGYTLVEIYSALAFAFVILPPYQSEVSANATLVAVAVTYGGAWRLMSMADDPFSYGTIDLVDHAIPDVGTSVFLGPLLDYRRLLVARLGNDSPTHADAAPSQSVSSDSESFPVVSAALGGK